MGIRARTSTFRRVAVAALAALFAASLWPAAPARADPPPWAPAHGWRAKHGHKHKHHHHDEDDDDDYRVEPVVLPFGLAERTCYRDLLGAALGGAAGGLAGSQFGKSSGKAAATIGGVILGAIVGGSIGRSMDRLDQACVGQVLEYVPDRQTVVWQNPNRDGYWVTPVRTYDAGGGRYCREYQSRAVIGGRVQQVHGTACRQPDGSWRIAN